MLRPVQHNNESTFFELLKEGEQALTGPEIEDPAADSKALLQSAFNLTFTELILKLRDNAAPTDAIDRFRRWITERKTGKPIAYIAQTVSFMNHTYHMAPGVLIPRPETELIIDALQEEADSNHMPPDLILELGVGSGVLSIESKLKFSQAEIRGWDINPAAVTLTQRNADLHQCQISITEGDFFRDLEKTASKIRSAKSAYLLTNPPYIRSKDLAHLPAQIQNFEPASALDGGPDGLDVYRKLIPWAQQLPLTLIGEIGFDQKESLDTILKQPPSPRYRFIKDVQSIPRIMVFRYH